MSDSSIEKPCVFLFIWEIFIYSLLLEMLKIMFDIVGTALIQNKSVSLSVSKKDDI